MKKFIFTITAFVAFQLVAIAQNGVNTTNPKAALDIVASNQATPANTDGLLIPRVDAFPLTNPTSDQNGMMLCLTTINGGKTPGTYYWDEPTTTWVKLIISSNHYIGELFGGGIVYYVYDNGNHGLIASLDDVDPVSGAQWGLDVTVANCGSTFDGAANTVAIMAAGGLTTDAAGLCDAYTGGGYTDWYLPSSGETFLLGLETLLINSILNNDGDSTTNGLSVDGATPIFNYWSSTQEKDFTALNFNISSLNSRDFFNNFKSSLSNVRAVRSF